ncbi:glycoside hydrolase family 95-like protein [Actinocrispum sp. NPDC049592]|uniref:glycosyl hydrolase family 95 catalytic domain-containing protein n=1 Tax=Actinocrispum sp. NPDC049592 TaxID=3154835 RepID=UPI00342EDDCD
MATAALAGVANPAQAADPAQAAADPVQAQALDWPAFVGQQDLVWKRLPSDWWQGPFLGDGLLGSMVYQEPGKNQIRFTTQHSEVQDYRPQFGSAWGVCRLPVGHLTLEPSGTISKVDWRLDLWNAELTGTVTTSKGTLTLNVFIHDQTLVAKATAQSGETVKWVFHEEKAISPKSASEAPPSGYTENPAPTKKTTENISQVTQNLVAGGQTATAYRKTGDTLLLTVAHTATDKTAEAKALTRIQNATETTLRTAHRKWWNAYYQKSFLSIPDQRLQSFHWAQLYKIASGTRADAPVMATCGPWLEKTGWPAVWWNLNVQLEYWLIHGSNHLELDAISKTLHDNMDNLIKNVRPEYQPDSAGVGRSTDRRTIKGSYVQRPGDSGSGEVGNLAWTLHNAWLSYRHTMDESLLQNTIFPLLRRTTNYYLHFLKKGDDGKLHLPQTLSPEYGLAPDANYDIALLRWSLQTLLQTKPDDPLAGKWQQTLKDLTPYPTDSTGFMIGAGVPYAKSHRHYSHLLMVYPLYLVTPDTAANRALIEKSVRHWHSIQGAHRGYSYTGAASMFAVLGNGNEALTYLLKFFDTSTKYPVTENTMYKEGSPVVETPLSASQSIHDMLCQSWGGVIRVFPAVPDKWADAALGTFRTQGAFLLSAVRRQGKTAWVKLTSEAGQPCRVKHGIAGDITVSTPDGTPIAWHSTGDGVIQIDLVKGATAVVYPKGALPDLTVAPVPITVPGKQWGLPS